MNPNIWGEPAWIFLHTITLSYPTCPSEQDKENYKQFFIALQHVLPCTTCKAHFNGHLKKYPLSNEVLSSKEKVIKWLIDVHNAVNITTNKPTMSYNEVLLKYNNMYSTNKLSNKMMIQIYVILIIFIFLIMILSVLFFR